MSLSSCFNYGCQNLGYISKTCFALIFQDICHTGMPETCPPMTSTCNSQPHMLKNFPQKINKGHILTYILRRLLVCGLNPDTCTTTKLTYTFVFSSKHTRMPPLSVHAYNLRLLYVLNIHMYMHPKIFLTNFDQTGLDFNLEMLGGLL